MDKWNLDDRKIPTVVNALKVPVRFAEVRSGGQFVLSGASLERIRRSALPLNAGAQQEEELQIDAFDRESKSANTKLAATRSISGSSRRSRRPVGPEGHRSTTGGCSCCLNTWIGGAIETIDGGLELNAQKAVSSQVIEHGRDQCEGTESISLISFS